MENSICCGRGRIILLLGLLLCALFSQQPVAAQDSVAVPNLPETLDTVEVAQFLSTLTDRQARDVLNRELLMRAKRESDKNTNGAYGGLGVALVRFRLSVSSFGATLTKNHVVLTQGLQALPVLLPAAFTKIAGSAGVMVLPDLLMAFAIGLFVYFLTLTVLASATRGLLNVSEASFFSRPLRGVARAALALIPVLFFSLASFAFVLLLRYPEKGASREFLVAYLSAAVLVLVINIVMRLLLAPSAPTLRLVPLDNQSARWVFNGVMVVSVIVLILWLTAGLVILTGMPIAAHLAIVVITGGVCALICAFVVVLAGRRIQQACFDTEFSTRFLVYWPWLASVYVLLVYVNWAWHMMSRTSTGVWSGIASIVVVLAIPVLDPAWCRFTTGLFRSNEPMSELGEPELDETGLDETGLGEFGAGESESDDVAVTSEMQEERRVKTEQHDYYRRIIRRAGLTTLYMICVILILELYGLSVLRLLFGENSREVVAAALIKVCFTVAITWAVWRSIAAVMDPRMPGEKKSIVDADDADQIPQTRLETLMPLLRFTVLFMVFLMSALIVLSLLGINIGPLLAGAGVLGIAIGFGAQTLVRDIVSGVFFLLDDAFRIGEYIEFENLRGEVESISLRSLKLRHHKGAIHTIPYGELRSITNYNRDWSIYKMEFRLHIDTDIEKTRKLIKKLGQQLLADPQYGPKFIQPMKSQGINRVEDTALFLRVKFMCKPREQYLLRRVAYVRLTQLFKENGIELAPRSVQIVGGDGNRQDDHQVQSAAASAIDDKPLPSAGGA